jgi:hypothetical protein
MRCKEYKLLASAYIDDELGAAEQAEFQAHLDHCERCLVELRQMERASALLKASPQPPVPFELRGYIISEARRRALGEVTVLQQALDWLLKLNPRFVSYTTGLVTSALLFAVAMVGFKPIPIPVIGPMNTFASTDVITGTDREYLAYNGMSPASESYEQNAFYELPRVMPYGSLTSFSHVAFQKPGSESAAALVEVAPSGHARIVQVLGAPRNPAMPSDPSLIRLLQWSLSKQPFRPAKRVGSGQPLPTRIVLVVDRIDVIG